MRWQLVLLGTLLGAPAAAQTDSTRRSIAASAEAGLVLRGPAREGAYLADFGRGAAVLGEETGRLEVWAWPLKLAASVRLALTPAGSGATAAAARELVAREVSVRPSGPTLLYRDSAFAVQQHVLVPLDQAGALLVLEVTGAPPPEIELRLRPELGLAWPADIGPDSAWWAGEERRLELTAGEAGRYRALVGSPRAVRANRLGASGEWSLTLATAGTGPVVVAFAGGLGAAEVSATYQRLLREWESLRRRKVAHHDSLQHRLLRLASPDSALDRAFAWAKADLDQELVCTPGSGCGLVAGFGAAGPGQFRAGPGTYAGSEAAWSAIALSGLGHLEPARQALEFLAARQRADGKLPSGVPLAGGLERYPQAWHRGDVTPLWLLACHAYWLASNDLGFLRRHWPSLVRAARWAAATDRNDDGLMDNPAAGGTQLQAGPAVVTDIALASAWVGALDAVSQMAEAVPDEAVRRWAARRYARAQLSLESSFWRAGERSYGSSIPLLAGPGAWTSWPALALALALLDPARADAVLQGLSGRAFSAGWGVRSLGSGRPEFDPYHPQAGAVSPALTGAVALAHYRYHRGWAGWELVRTWAGVSRDFGLGRQPELLSGTGYRAVPTGLPHHFGGSAALAGAVVRGVLGLEADAPHQAVAIEPHLPAAWDSVRIAGLRAGPAVVGVAVSRGEGSMQFTLQQAGSGRVHVRLAPALPLGARVERVTVAGRDVPLQLERSEHDVHVVVELALVDEAEVEVEFSGGVEVLPPEDPGGTGASPRVVDFRLEGEEYVVGAEARAGSWFDVVLRTARPVRAVRGAAVLAERPGYARLRVQVPAAGSQVAVRFRA